MMRTRLIGIVATILLILGVIAAAVHGVRARSSAQAPACTRAEHSTPGGDPAPLIQKLKTQSWLGDGGHFFKTTTPRILVNNPDGRPFSLTVHQHLWKADVASSICSIVVRAPDGRVSADGHVEEGAASATVAVPGGPRGVYTIEMVDSGYSLSWVESSLPQMVAQTERFDAVGNRAFQLHAMVPRRWYFYVPRGTRKFLVRHVIQLSQTHREDFGLFVMNPRGQRVDALFGGKSLDMRPTLGHQHGFPQTPRPVPVTRTIEVDPGTDGRFWSLWITGGDSHNYSDLMVQLDGVPPYLAPSPEQWFDPSTGRAANPEIYDRSVIRHPDVVDANGAVQQAIPRYFSAPATFLGDEGYNGWRGPHTIWLKNPENRRLVFGVQTYLASPQEQTDTVAVRVTGPAGTAVLEQKLPLDGSSVIPAAGGGIYRLDLDGRHWFAWMHPAPPMVLAGQPIEKGGTRFGLETGIARHWFFQVPAATQAFSIAADVHDPDQVLRVEVHAPDRIVEEMAVRGGAPRELEVAVPPDLAGRTWFLRTEIGSASRFVTTEGTPRQMTIEADLTLRGVPGFLAPTWEQRFDPYPTDAPPSERTPSRSQHR